MVEKERRVCWCSSAVPLDVVCSGEGPDFSGFRILDSGSTCTRAHIHLHFEGPENIARGEFDDYISEAGGTNNANTSNDRTCTFYYELLPSNQLELGLWLESERLLHAKVEDVGIETQRQVVTSNVLFFFLLSCWLSELITFQLGVLDWVNSQEHQQRQQNAFGLIKLPALESSRMQSAKSCLKPSWCGGGNSRMQQLALYV